MLEPDNNNALDDSISQEPDELSFTRKGLKIFVITNSVTNYFCCGVNLRELLKRVKSIAPVTSVKEKLGGEKVFECKKKFVSSVIDWLLDVLTTLYHASKLTKPGWIQASFTYAIVLFSGFITTIGFLRDADM